MSKTMERVMSLMFTVYGIIMLYLLFFQRGRGFSEINIIPFKTIGEFWLVMRQNFGSEVTASLFVSSFVNLAGNVLMFIPLGFFPPFIWKAFRRFIPDMVLCAAVIIAVELMQYVTDLGCADIDDLILNIFGAAMGWCIFAVLKKVLNRAKPESL